MLNSIVKPFKSKSKQIKRKHEEVIRRCYIDYKYIPKSLKVFRDIYQHMKAGASMLELLNDRFITPRNLRDLKDILNMYFNIHLDKLLPVVVNIDEFEIVYVSFNKFKIRVYIDLD